MEEHQQHPSLQTQLDPQHLAPMLLVQNMMRLIKHLRLPVILKVSRLCHEVGQQTHGTSSSQQDKVQLAVVVHVLYDYAFRKYLQYCSASDLLLLRGLLLKVEVDAAYQSIKSVSVQQAFLPKFENEMEDSKVAAAIVQEANVRPMLITIKHSGSLVTLSGAGFASKNSVNNEFTAGAALLLQTHYQRLLGQEEGLQRLKGFMKALQEQSLAVSFEMVTGSHGHHGQLPQGEYLVTTSAHTSSPSGQPSFLPWKQFLSFCLEWNLPLNDTWLLQGQAAAGAARELLDHQALSGCTTGEAMQQLHALVQPQDAGPTGQTAAENVCLYFPGTYPHDEWQGSRLEGFVVGQGQPIQSQEVLQELLMMTAEMAKQVIRLESVQQELRKPYQQELHAAGGDVAAAQAAVLRTCSCWLPAVGYDPVDVKHRNVLVDLLESCPVHLTSNIALHLPDGQTIYSRAALETLPPEELQKLLQDKQAQPGDATAALQESPNVLQAMLALSGPQSTTQAGLRYKKKMLMWGDKEVGYMMMTMGVRNGLTALRLGERSYLTALAATARHTWGLPEALVGKVVYFGRCWTRWIACHGGVTSVNSDTYLDAAEPFVRDFLAGLADAGGEQRPAGAFQGVVVALDASERFVQQLQKAMHLQHLLQPNSGDLVFSKSLVQEGTCLWLPPDNNKALKKNKSLVEFLKAAGPYVYYIEQPVRVPRSAGENQAKRIAGQHRSKVYEIRKLLTDNGLLTEEQLEQRTVLLPQLLATASAVPAASGKQVSKQVVEGLKTTAEELDEEEDYEATGDHFAAAVQSVVQRFGGGSPPAKQDPAVITCFVTIPGIGKSALLTRIGASAADSSSSNGSTTSGSSEVSISMLNGDIMRAKQGITGMRYWHQVSGAADSCQGGNHCMLVLADKNLVPAPRDNIQRVSDIIRKSGATTVAVLPTCSVRSVAHDVSTANANQADLALDHHQQQQQHVFELPFPLELVALCMLRVLQRQSHEGGLDANSKHAMSIVMQFASYFRGLRANQLKQQLQGCFDHVIELPVAAIGVDQQVPAEVLNHISDGVTLMMSSPNSDPPLPPDWESKMCQLLQDSATQAAISAIALPLQDCVVQLRSQIAAVIDSSRQAAAAAASEGQQGGGGNDADAAVALSAGVGSTGVSGTLGELSIGASSSAAEAAVAGGPSVRYIAVAVDDDDEPRQQIQQLLNSAAVNKPQQQPQQQQQSLVGGVQQQQQAIKCELHVTLWHADSTSSHEAAAAAAAVQQRDALLAVAGQQVQMQLVALDISPEVTAAQVELLHGPDAVVTQWQQLPYPHMTLTVAEGYKAVDSNHLPSRVADEADVAYRVPLREPLLISGQVLQYE